MSEQFYTILTQIGKASIANASALGTKVEFKYFALGDGNGSYYNPTEAQTNLRNEVWRGQIGQVVIDENNPNWIVLETVIPASVGGFNIREAGVFDVDGNLLAIGKYPETYKPLLENGSAKDLYVRMILEVANTSVVTLKVDPSIILATKKDIDTLSNRITKNANDISELKKGSTVIEELQTENKTLSGAINEVDEKVKTHLAEKVQHLSYATASGTNTYTVAIEGVTSLIEGMSVKIKFTNANTGASTLNINSLGAKAINKSNGNTLSSGNIKAGQICHLVYTGSVFQLLGEGGEYGTAQQSHVLSPYTIGTEEGIKTGAMVNRGELNLDLGDTLPAGYYSGGIVPNVEFGFFTKQIARTPRTSSDIIIELVNPSYRLIITGNNPNNVYTLTEVTKDGIVTIATKNGYSPDMSGNIAMCYKDGFLYCIKGNRGSEYLRKINFSTGALIKEVSVPYATAITIRNGDLWVFFNHDSSNNYLRSYDLNLNLKTSSATFSVGHSPIMSPNYLYHRNNTSYSQMFIYNYERVLIKTYNIKEVARSVFSSNIHIDEEGNGFGAHLVTTYNEYYVMLNLKV